MNVMITANTASVYAESLDPVLGLMLGMIAPPGASF
jgi:hypothetical protein